MKRKERADRDIYGEMMVDIKIFQRVKKQYLTTVATISYGQRDHIDIISFLINKIKFK